MSTSVGKKRAGVQSTGATKGTAARNTVFKLEDGTRVTSGRVTVQRRKYTPRARACKVCHVDFTPLSRTGKYCSDACRAKAYRDRKAASAGDNPREVIVEALTCPHCREGFFAVKGKRAVFCSPSCRASAYKRRRAAAIIALAEDLAIDHDAAYDVFEKRGLVAVVSHLELRGFHYDYAARQWVLPYFGMVSSVERTRIERT